VGDLLHFNDNKGTVFEIVIQLGAILAVCWEFRSRIAAVIVNVTTQKSAQRFFINLFLAFLPAALLGLLFHHQIKAYLFSPVTVAVALIVGGLAILYIEKWAPSARTVDIDNISHKQALQIGCAQALALVPGTSRAAATILGGMVFGLTRQTATEFSFLLAIPIMFAATGFDLFSNRDALAWADFGMFAVGFVTAFCAALVAIKTLLRYVARHDFKAFAWYRILFGLIVLVYFWPAA
jgi:undecaprenyl-diphosphatase